MSSSASDIDDEPQFFADGPRWDISVVIAVAVAVAWVPLAGVGVAVGMLGLLTIALISPAGPTVMFELPQEVDR